MNSQPSNLNRAFRAVKRNKGAAGVDGKTIAETLAYLQAGHHAQALRESLLQGEYLPQAVRGVHIPKPDGGSRPLGIPTVIDRWLQQAIAQVLTGIYEPQFSASSFGFRPGRGAHDALRQAQGFKVRLKAGRCYPCWRIVFWMNWIKNWNAAGTDSVATPAGPGRARTGPSITISARRGATPACSRSISRPVELKAPGRGLPAGAGSPRYGAPVRGRLAGPCSSRRLRRPVGADTCRGGIPADVGVDG